MKFTKEEISLCKQVAEKHKRKIEYGGWYINFDEEVRLKEFFGDGYREEDCFPLWTISDCLEFLNKHFYKLRVCSDRQLEVEVWMLGGSIYHWGKTPLEACLRAVLAVLEEK